RKHEIPIDGCHQWLRAKVEIWDETSSSNDGEYSEPENVTYHKGEKIQYIGCVYQKINLERHCLSPLPLIVASAKRRCRHSLVLGLPGHERLETRLSHPIFLLSP